MNNYKRLGDYIQLVDKRNKELAVTKVCGLSMEKYFIPSIANTNTVDLSNYKTVEKGQFGLILMKVGRDNKVSVAILEDEEAVLISPAYHVFEIIDKTVLLPDFLMIWLLRPENDRWLGFISVSSIRGSITFEEFGGIQLPIPDIEEQRKYVALYKGLLNNQKVYKNSLDDLQLICDTYMEDLIKTEESKLLGGYIEKIDERNVDNKYNSVKGMSVLKFFRTPSKKVNMKNLSNYRVVRYNDFGYVQTTNNEKVLIVCLSKFEEPIIISSIHTTFKVKDEKKIIPEYLQMFFKCKEIDRYARFHSWGSARETFNWDDMCNIKLPIPDIKIQEAIVTIYHTLETRKRINEQLKDSIKPFCPVLMRGVVEEIEKSEVVI
ncbi:Type I restriction-modification system, specificity subunit S (EC 3.1.21.3) [uncultured Gammaproteobacteria bacterium]|nr:Type I restriction-modification system, specificity subunit S (EC 3.1.21.3) [uncultured Gammaproteobacteria bacterium]